VLEELWMEVHDIGQEAKTISKKKKCKKGKWLFKEALQIAEFATFAGILSAALSQHHLL